MTEENTIKILEKAKRISLAYRLEFVEAIPFLGNVIRMAVRRNGNVYLSAMGTAENNRADGEIYSIDWNNKIQRILEGIHFPKALWLSTDEKFIYFSETWKPIIWKYDLIKNETKKFNQKFASDSIYSIVGSDNLLCTVDRDKSLLAVYDEKGRCLQSLDTTSILRYPMDAEFLDDQRILVVFQLSREGDDLKIGKDTRNVGLWDLTKKKLTPIKCLALDSNDISLCSITRDSKNNFYVTSFSSLWKMGSDLELKYKLNCWNYLERNQSMGDSSSKNERQLLLFDVKYNSGTLFLMERRSSKKIYVFNVE